MIIVLLHSTMYCLNQSMVLEWRHGDAVVSKKVVGSTQGLSVWTCMLRVKKMNE